MKETMGLVATWLSGIGLSHAIPAFNAAGIVTPAALAELDVTYYEALGVKDAADRRKLFYLVQRIKMASDSNEQQSEQQEIDEVLRQTAVPKSKTKLVLDEEDSLEGQDEENELDELLDSPEPEKVKPRASSKNRISSTTTRPSTLKSNSRRSLSVKSAADDNQQTNPEPKLTRSRARATAVPAAAATVKTSRKEQAEDEDEHDDQELEPNDDSDWDEESLSADDEASQSRRSSRRLQEKRKQQQTVKQAVESSSSIGSQDEQQQQHQTTTRRSTLARSSSTTSATGYTGDVEEPSKTKRVTSSSRLRRASTSDLDADDESSIHRPIRKSGVQAPARRRFESNLQKPTRTGKGLSTIPSDSVAPMSPLLHVPVSRLDADISHQQKLERKRRTDAVAKGRSLSFGESDTSETSRKRSNSRGRLSTGGISTSGSDSELLPRRRRTSLGGGGGSDGEHSQSDLRDRRSGGATSGSDSEIQRTRVSTGGLPQRRAGRRSLSENKGGAVFVHGTAEDTSWYSQVGRLREDNQAEHELFHGQALDDELTEEMRIRVLVRKRPMSNSEQKATKEIDVVHPLDYNRYGRILVYQPKIRVDLTRQVETVPFAFDNVFDENSTNQEIYDRAVRDLIPDVFNEGKWASVFAYGQTGSGKTFTMMGCNVTGIKAGTSKDDMANYGLYYMAALDVFDMANQAKFKHMSIGVSLFEIYGGKLFDLLNNRKPVKCLEDHRGKVCFPGLSEHPVKNADEVMRIIESGACNRSTGTTSKNADSSRSHAILQISVRKNVGRQVNVEHGRLTFIDLAGSERGADTDKASRATRLEGAEINTSLLALKEVIRALATGDSMTHIPFRGSKLTQVLKESFVGENATSVMVACIAPNMSNCEHTLNTLRYADRVKERNATTGALSASVTSKRTKRMSRQSSKIVPAEEEFDEKAEEGFFEEGKEDRYDDDFQSNPFASAVKSPMSPDNLSVDNLLDELLTETPDSSAPETAAPSVERRVLQGSSGHGLVSAHRSIMSDMLRMCKEEMSLANNADADRDSIDSYLEELSKMHEKQCEMLTTLHEKLLEYRGGNTLASDRSEDDSFEDLRG